MVFENNVRFVYASSAATYGDGTFGMDDRDEDIEKFQPLNLYGWSKQKFDILAQKNGWFDSIVGLKYFNVYGPNEEHKGDMRSVVSKAYREISETKKNVSIQKLPPRLFRRRTKRDFLYVKDAVQMTIWLTQNCKSSGLFNLGNGTARTWLDLGNAIFKGLNIEPDINFIEMPQMLRDKYQYFTQATIEKLKSHGYNYELFSLEEAVSDYVRNYLVPDLKLGPKIRANIDNPIFRDKMK